MDGDSPIRPPPPPPPPPAVEPVAPSSPHSQLPVVDSSRDGSLSPENPAPHPPPPTGPTTSPPRTGDSSPSSPPHPPTPPPPLPPSADASPPLPREDQTSPPSSPPCPSPAPVPPPLPAPVSAEAKSASPPLPREDETSPPRSPPRPSPAPVPPPPPAPAPAEANSASPPLPREGQTSPPRSPPRPSPALVPPPPPAAASAEAKSEQEAAESASESGSMTLALALTQTEDSTPPTPPKEAFSTEASPIGSPEKESAVTIAKLLSGEDPAAAVAKPAVDKVAPPNDTGSLPAAAAVTGVGGGGGGVGSKRWLLGGRVPEKVRRTELRRAELGFRVSAAVFCLVALSVVAADTTAGWSGDSFRRYNEYRYVLAASVVAFTYSGFQLVAEVHYLVTGRRIIRGPWRGYFNLAMDQMLAYLLLSASSTALSRNGVWMSRFGGDQFTKLINASASMAFLAFIALGLSSIISAYCVFSLVS